MTSPGAEGPKPRSPSLDAAVEAMCRSEHPLWGQYRPDARAEVAQKMSRALEAALPHLQSSPEGDRPREPFLELRAAAITSDSPLSGNQLTIEYTADGRLEATCQSGDGDTTWGESLTHEATREFLAALREEQGR